jgi:hypothetical protein
VTGISCRAAKLPKLVTVSSYRYMQTRMVIMVSTVLCNPFRRKMVDLGSKVTRL